MSVNWDEFTPVPGQKPIQQQLSSGPAAPVDWSQFTPVPGQDAAQKGALSRGFETSMRQIPQTVGGALGLLGDATGSDGLRDYGMGIYKKQSDKIAQMSNPNDSFSNVLEGSGSPVEWAKYGAGYLGGQALTAVATGGVGGFIGKQAAKMGIQAAAKGAVEKGVAGAVADEAAKQTLSRGAKIGAASALGANNFVQEAGQIYPDAVDQAQKDGRQLTGSDLARIGGSAAAAAGVDTLADAAMFHGLTHAGGSSAATFAKRALRTIPGGMLREGGTEGVQTAIERYGAGQDMTNQDAIRDYVDSAALGAFGGAAGGGASALHRAAPAEAKAAEPGTQSTAPAQPQPVDVTATAAPVANLSALSDQRNQTNAMIGQLEDMIQRGNLGKDADRIHAELNQMYQTRDNLTAQMGQSIDQGAANQMSGQLDTGGANDPLSDRLGTLNSFLSDPDSVSGLRQADPQGYQDFLRAYAFARNPQQDGVVRTSALDAIDGYLQRNGVDLTQQAQPVALSAERAIVPTQQRAEAPTYQAPAGLLAPAIQADTAGNATTTEQRNSILQQQADQPAEAIRDVTPIPQRTDVAQAPLALPLAPAFVADTNGNISTQDDRNAAAADSIAARLERARRVATGDILDRTPVRPSEAMGLDPARGSLSAAAAIAVDTGAHQTQQAATATPTQTAAHSTAAPVQATPQISPVIAARTDSQLQSMAVTATNPDVRAQAQAEIARRADQQSAPVQQQTGVQQDVTQATQAQQAGPQPAQAGAAPVAAAGAPVATPTGLTVQPGAVRTTADHVQQMPAGQVTTAPVAPVEQRAEHTPAQAQPLTVDQAGQHWDQMSPADRKSLAMQADGLNKLQRANVHTAAWGKINGKVQQALATQINQRFAEAQPVIQQQNAAAPAQNLNPLQQRIAAARAAQQTAQAETPAMNPLQQRIAEAQAKKAQAAAPRPLNQAAHDLLTSVDQGGVPAMMTNQLRMIARQNGVEVTGKTTPNDVVSALQARRESQGAAVEGEQAAQKAPSGPMFSREKTDAEKAAFLNGPPIRTLTGEEGPAIKAAAPLRVWATKLFESQGSVANSPELGPVALTPRSVRDSLGHSISPHKIAAFAAVKDVIEKGEVVYSELKRAETNSFYISAPVSIGGVDDIVTVLVRRDVNSQRMYLHSVAVRESLRQHQVPGAGTAVPKRSGSSTEGGIQSVLTNLLNFKQENEKSPAAAQEGNEPKRSAGLSADAYDTARRVLLGDQEPKSTVAGVQQELTGKVGTLGDRIHVVQSVLDLPPAQRRQLFSSYGGYGATGVQGVYFPDSQHAFMIADNIAPGHAYATLLHEAGVHAGMRGMIGDEGMHTLSSQIRAWAESGQGEEGRIARAAMDRIPGDTRSHQQDEELIAYFVEEAAAVGHGDVSAHGPIAQWFARLWDYVRAAVAKLGGNPEQLTANDIVALAQGAMERVANGRTQEIMRMRPAGENSIGPTFGSLDGIWLEPTFEIHHGESDFDRGGFTEHGLMGHLSQATEGSRTYGFNVFDHTGQRLGYLAGDVKNGRIVAVHDMEIGSKSKGTGSRVIAGLTANGPVKAVDILDQSENFWRKHGAERDWNGNGQTHWGASQQSLDGQSRGSQGEGRSNADVSSTGRTDQAVQRGSGGVLEDDARKWLEENSKIAGGGEGVFFASRSPLSAMKRQFTEDSTTETVGVSHRQYSPEQQAFFKRTGREVEKPTLKGTFKGVWQDVGKKLAQGVFDQFAPIKDISEKGYILARMSKGSAGAFQALMEHGKLNIRDGMLYDADQSGGVIDKLFKPLQGEGEDFLWWVASKRAERLAAEGRENLFTAQDIAAGQSLAQGQTDFDYTLQHNIPGVGKAGAVTRSRAAMYADAARTLDEFNRNVLDMAEQSGLIDGASRKVWENEFYVPFYRVSAADGEFVGARVKSGLIRQQAFKQLKGGSNKINADMMTNVMSNWAHLLDASAKNRAASATLQDAAKVGIARAAVPGETKTVWYLDKGQKKEFKVDDPYTLTALNGLEYAGLTGPMMDAMSRFKYYLTAGVTMSPIFKVKNLIRDSIQSIGLSGLSYNPAQNLAEGWKATDHKTQTYVSLLASGGIIKFGNMLEGRESERIRRLVNAGVDPATILDSDSKVKEFYAKYLEPAFNAYQELGNRGEEINRAALYKQLVSQGVDHATAALQARDLLDFSMQGSFSSIRLLTQVVPFLNARLQGLYKIGRATKEDPRKMSIVLGAIALASVALMLGYKDDDDWKRREDWDRDQNWWFKFGGTAFRIPKPFEFGAIGSLAERGVELFASDEMTGQRFTDRLLSLLSDNLSMNPIPQMVKPMMDVYANKDSFTGNQIESEAMQNMRSTERYNINTSMAARAASTAGNAVTGLAGQQFLSPVQIDHLIRGYFGWLGTSVTLAADQFARPAVGEPDRPDRDLLKSLTGGMVSSTDDGVSRYVSQMYQQQRELSQAYATWRQKVRTGQVDDAREFFADNRDKIVKSRMLSHVAQAEAKVNAQIHIEEFSNDPGDIKAEKLKNLKKIRDGLARRIS